MGAENENALECGREGQSQGFRAEGSGALSILTDATGQPWENKQHPPVPLLPKPPHNSSGFSWSRNKLQLLKTGTMPPAKEIPQIVTSLA